MKNWKTLILRNRDNVLFFGNHGLKRHLPFFKNPEKSAFQTFILESVLRDIRQKKKNSDVTCGNIFLIHSPRLKNRKNDWSDASLHMDYLGDDYGSRSLSPSSYQGGYL